MGINRFHFLVLLFFVAILGHLNYQLWRPFLAPIAWALVLSIVFYPLYAFLLRFIKWRTVASLITLIVILMIILGPFSYLTVVLVNELKAVSSYLDNEEIDIIQNIAQHPQTKRAIDLITSFFNITEKELKETVANNVSRFGKELVTRITTGLGDVVTVLVSFVFMSFATFFMLKDGPDFLSRFRDYEPFPDEQKDRLEKQIRDIIISTVYGGVAVAIVQGIIGGLAYFLLDVPSPVLWGLATAVASFIPLIGAFAVWGPAAAYLFLQDMILNGLILVFVGVLLISAIDNVLKPIIIGGRTKMPVLFIFFSVLGGIKLFGLIGLVMGPLVMALFISVIEIFRNVEGGQKQG
ncbi:MAG: AI-2E family transporter [Nitrospirae bacterium]|nr:AI-2E family transporter [Nitrospirota bacterium]